MQSLESRYTRPANAPQEIEITPGFFQTDLRQLAQIDTQHYQQNFEQPIRDLQQDHSQHKFFRDERFDQSWDHIQGEKQDLIIDLLRLYCEAEYAGFVLYKELSFQLKESNRILAEGFALMARDEARHAGFLNKALLDFNRKPKLDFLKREQRTYTKLPFPGFVYSTFLSEKMSSCYYRSLFEHLKVHPDYAIYPIFDFYPAWSDDENRHSNFFGAMIQSTFQDSVWNRWVCKFYLIASFSMSYARYPKNAKLLRFLGLNARDYYISTIRKVNRRIQPQTPVTLDLQSDDFFETLDQYLRINSKNQQIEESSQPNMVKWISKIPNYLALIWVVLRLGLVRTKRY